ncbi:hypothetical protein [Sphingosinicella sp. BN140058]|uniref:hypothetical protein n=1 Tax=Sphingosinicella sp. BN140058 TaxID=1892855 RepID=UPI001010701E|nr:hypothetical protein [Sphingosinicella sp. BN140058]QAY80248.1 hypothetical protein ETR14_26760 [Sphingosinicella sp. BN140058]
MGRQIAHIPMIARRNDAGWDLFEEAMQVPFGHLAFGEFGWIFSSVDEAPEFDERPGYIQHRLREGMTFQEALATVRAGMEAMYADQRSESDAELASENAWLRHAELPTLDDMGFEAYERARGVFYN